MHDITMMIFSKFQKQGGFVTMTRSPTISRAHGGVWAIVSINAS
jgi:hypothetical protein